MVDRKTVTLVEPIEWHGGKKITELTFRPPKGREYFMLGEPVVLAQTKEKVLVQSENDEVIKKYVEVLLDDPREPLLIEHLSLRDAINVKDAVIDFFSAARKAL